MSLKSVVWRLLIYKENSTNCYFSIYLLGWETLVTNPNAINTVRLMLDLEMYWNIEFQEGNVQDLVVVAKHL